MLVVLLLALVVAVVVLLAVERVAFEVGRHTVEVGCYEKCVQDPLALWLGQVSVSVVARREW